MEVGPGLKSGVRIRMDNPAQLGGELLCAVVGALRRAEPPLVVVNFDTATTLLAVDAAGALVGGQIEAVEKETYQVLDANGNWVTDPDHVTLIFTVTTTTPTAEVMTTKVGDQEVRIGKTDYILKSEYIEFSGGTIVDVQWEGLAEE